MSWHIQSMGTTDTAEGMSARFRWKNIRLCVHVIFECVGHLEHVVSFVCGEQSILNRECSRLPASVQYTSSCSFVVIKLD